VRVCGSGSREPWCGRGLKETVQLDQSLPRREMWMIGGLVEGQYGSYADIAIREEAAHSALVRLRETRANVARRSGHPARSFWAGSGALARPWPSSSSN
jgi:hypothetical protein